MKKLIAILVVLALVAGTVFAQQPIGLKVYIDGFSFGDVAYEDYVFAGEDKGNEGLGNITPGVQYNKSFGDFALEASVQDKLEFKKDVNQTIRLHVKGAYKIAISDASTLTPYAYNRLFFKGDGEDFAETDKDQITNEIAGAIRFDQNIGVGTVYADVQIGVEIHTQDGKDANIRTGQSDDIRIGYDSSTFYGYVQPRLVFTEDYQKEESVFENINIRVGYKALGPINARVTVGIPTYEKGIDADGLVIQPRATWSNIIPGLEAYLDFKISNIASDNDGDIGFTPTIGVSYAF